MRGRLAARTKLNSREHQSKTLMGGPSSHGCSAGLLLTGMVSFAGGLGTGALLLLLRGKRRRNGAGPDGGSTPATRRDAAAAASQPPAPTYEHPPNTSWSPGQPSPSPLATSPRMSIDPTGLDAGSVYSLMTSCVVPRPIAFVTSLSREGQRNLAPYSYFNVVRRGMHADTWQGKLARTWCARACMRTHACKHACLCRGKT